MSDIITVDQAFIENRPLSVSSLKAFGKSPKHYIQYLNKPWEPKDAFILGSLIDCLVLTPEDLEKKFIVYEKFAKRSNADKEKWAGMLADAQENKQTLVTKEMMVIAKTCRTALMDNEQARTLIEHKKNVQRKLLWRDKSRDLPIVSYVDFESTAWDTDFIVDLKSSKSADPKDFVRDAVNYGYQIQTGGYLEGYKNIEFRFPQFIFLVVETDEPFNVSINFCDTRYVDAAVKEWNGLLQAFRYCLDNKHFDMGYDFRLFGLKEYFNMEIPKYYKPNYPEGFGDE